MVDAIPGSILDSVKKSIGIDPTYTTFDPEITMHINSVFATLHQLGVGPVDSLVIDDNTNVWDEFILEQKNINSVKTYVAQKVKLIFDPPTSSFANDALKNSCAEFEWRLNVEVENANANN